MQLWRSLHYTLSHAIIIVLVLGVVWSGQAVSIKDLMFNASKSNYRRYQTGK